jgi:integrase
MGLYQRPDSDVYWISYLDGNKRRVRESTGTSDKETAARILDDKKGKVARGDELLPRVDRVRYDEAAESLVAYYETRRARTVVETKVRLLNLNAFFKGRTLPSITEDLIEAYARQRLDEDAGPATINRELATLSKMLRLAYQRRRLARLPKIERLQEPPPRAGFVTREQYDSIARRLPEDLQAATLVGFTYGWRLREFLHLRKDQVDLKAGAHGTLRLDPGQTKNGEGRVVHLTSELRALLEGLSRVTQCSPGVVIENSPPPVRWWWPRPASRGRL